MAKIAAADRPVIDFGALEEPEIVVSFTSRPDALTLDGINPYVQTLVERAYTARLNQGENGKPTVAKVPVPDETVAKELARLAVAYGRLRSAGEISVGATFATDLAGKTVLTVNARPKIHRARKVKTVEVAK